MSNEPAKVEAGQALLEQFDVVDPFQQPPEAEVAAEPVAQPAAEVKAPEPKHPSWLARAAAKVGMEADEIQHMTTDELKVAVNTLAQASANDRRIEDVERSVRQRDPSTGQFVKQPEKPAEPEKEPEFSLKDIGIDEDGLDEMTTADILKKLAKPMMDKIKSLESQLAQQNQREQAREAKAIGDQLDQMFDTNSAVYGKGSRQEMKPGSPEYLRRYSTIEAMKQLHLANPSLTLKQAFEQASKSLFGQTTPPAQTEPVVTDDSKFKNGHTVRPTVRQTRPEPNGVHKATATVESFFNERLKPSVSEELDTLPDL